LGFELALGNDIVDLRDPRCQGKVSDRRFLRRVFSPSETSRIQGAPDPDRALWAHWGAKEAAFKVVSRLLGAPPPFEHARFHVELDFGESSPSIPPLLLRGSVRYQDIPIHCSCQCQESWIHVVAWHGGDLRRDALPPPIVTGFASLGDSDPGPPEEWTSRLRSRFSDEEWDCVHSRASAVARLEARSALAHLLAVTEERLRIVCGPGMPGRRMPLVSLDGQEAGVRLSLSHHGALAAWAFLSG
jgi:phosphopantetheine--protein transferase-like protein